MTDSKKYVGVAPLTMLLVVPPGYVNVHAGEPVPDNANPDDLKRLVDEGFLAEATPVDDPGSESEAAPQGGVKEILAEVGDDKDKAAAALEAERAGKNRSTLVAELEKILTA